MYSCIDRFQSRGQQLYKLLGIKQVLTCEKSCTQTSIRPIRCFVHRNRQVKTIYYDTELYSTFRRPKR